MRNMKTNIHYGVLTLPNSHTKIDANTEKTACTELWGSIHLMQRQTPTKTTGLWLWIHLIGLKVYPHRVKAIFAFTFGPMGP